MEALPNFTVAIGVFFPMINAGFIHLHHLASGFCLQLLLKCLALEVIPFLVAVSLFLRLHPILPTASLRFCGVTLSPHSESHFSLRVPPMLLDKLTKPLPICDFMPTPLLIMGDSLAVSTLRFSLQP